MLLRYNLFFQIAIFIMASKFALSEVTISIGNVNVDGYTENIVVPITVSNPNEAVGGFQFDIVSIPAIINLSGVSAVNENARLVCNLVCISTFEPHSCGFLMGGLYIL